MSYDLMVFDPAAAPRERAAFMDWYDTQSEWAEGHDYDDPAVTTPALRAWFMEMIKTFPAMSGPYAAADDEDAEEDSRFCEYCIGKSLIYASFAWSQQAAAYQTMRELAIRHGVGFFDVSGDVDTSEIRFPA